MTTKELLSKLEKAGVKLAVAGSKLRYDAPAGVLTPELKEALREHKPELVALLRKQKDPLLRITQIFCYHCYLANHRYHQPHTVARSRDYPGWLGLTCQRCGNVCYVREDDPAWRRKVEKYGLAQETPSFTLTY